MTQRMNPSLYNRATLLPRHGDSRRRNIVCLVKYFDDGDLACVVTDKQEELDLRIALGYTRVTLSVFQTAVETLRRRNEQFELEHPITTRQSRYRREQQEGGVYQNDMLDLWVARSIGQKVR